MPFTALGNVAAVYAHPNDDVRLFYQAPTKVIMQYSVVGPFTAGQQTDAPIALVPASEVLSGSPISSVLGPAVDEVFSSFSDSVQH